MYYMESMDVFSYIIHMLMSVTIRKEPISVDRFFSYGNNFVKHSSFMLLEYRAKKVYPVQS